MYDNTCHCGGLELPDLIDDSGWDAIYERITAGLLDNTIEKIPSDMYFKTAEKLMEAVYSGLGATQFEYDDQRAVLGAELRSNIYAFSAAKSFTQMIHFRNLMLDEEDKIRSYTSFRKKIADAGVLFNNHYLNTEYNTASQSAIMAHKWDALNTEYLEFSTVNDDRVRPEHQALDKFTALKTDPVWNKIYPPLAFNCRCTVIPGKKVNNEKKMSSVDAQKMINPYIKNTPFDNNVGISRLVFTESHPYFKNLKGEEKNLSWEHYGMKSIEQIRKNNFSNYKATTLEEYLSWWENQPKVKDDDFVLTDVLGQSILMDSGVNKRGNKIDYFKDHILRKKDENRFKYGTEVPNILSNPDEVWFNPKDGDSYFYIKYYENDTLKLVVNKNLTAVTLYDIKAKNSGELQRSRKGVLLFKK